MESPGATSSASVEPGLRGAARSVPPGRPGVHGPASTSAGRDLIQILEEHGERLAVARFCALGVAGRRRPMWRRRADETRQFPSLRESPLAKQLGRPVDRTKIVGTRIAERRTPETRRNMLGRLQPDARAAPRASDVLGVEPAVGGIGVLAPALRAGRKIDHRRPLAVERRRGLDAEPRPAVGAAGEREAERVVVRGSNSARHAGQAARSGVMTTRTGGAVRVRPTQALLDREAVRYLRDGMLLDRDLVNLGRTRMLSPQPIAKRGQPLFGPRSR